LALPISSYQIILAVKKMKKMIASLFWKICWQRQVLNIFPAFVKRGKIIGVDGFCLMKMFFGKPDDIPVRLYTASGT